ncbi:MAG: competence/damage-inducible protein A [Pseudomonadota bacterium]|jgi:molybdopterin-biosynthesis enzyme MoeA-like protein|uniref:competence/damage-inducible protein A n=1 Tax=Sulfuricystis thermophila TaxID=2496847 RepID=UPI001035C724|nr:molybdopterin-binding protein [Sulfuricystis thermophila]MDI6749870.1 molybdopterin-binding protein [Rhodocyclaceae bacterium]
MRTYGLVIIGDEILRGKRPDRHLAKFIEMLAARGLHLSWAEYLGDERPRLIETFRRTLASNDVVFSCGGIGVTPDDHTRQAAAAAAGVPLELNPEAEREIRARMAEIGEPVTPARLELGTVPQGSRIIPNPFNRIPGFSYRDHHFLPGFPQMAWPMAEWVLDTYYADDFRQGAEAEAAILVWEGLEGRMLELMRQTEADFPGVTVFSLPFLGSETMRRHVELGVRGAPDQVAQAIEALKAGVAALGYRFDIKT